MRKPPFMTMSAATICPATVATAAPAMPISGKTQTPKMSKGSSTMLTAAPAICANMGTFMLPTACKTFVHTLSRKSPKLRTQAILP